MLARRSEIFNEFFNVRNIVKSYECIQHDDEHFNFLFNMNTVHYNKMSDIFHKQIEIDKYRGISVETKIDRFHVIRFEISFIQNFRIFFFMSLGLETLPYHNQYQIDVQCFRHFVTNPIEY